MTIRRFKPDVRKTILVRAALGAAILAAWGCDRPQSTGNQESQQQESVRIQDIRRKSAEPEPEHVAKLRKAAESGDAQSQFDLGRWYSFELAGPRDQEEAVKWYLKAADQGHAVAQLYLGIAYSIGDGVPVDEVQSVAFYRKAAEQGHEIAQYSLGRAYATGSGVAQDYAEAVGWYRKAAEQGFAGGQHQLGCYYYSGRGVPKDYVEAAEWFRKAAERGDEDAQYILGLCYERGEGLEKDDEEAMKWIRRAAEQGQVHAQFSLGQAFRLGRGVSMDYVEAAKWYHKSAEKGHGDAQLSLGAMYAMGEGVPRNYEEAVNWFRKAAGQGVSTAQQNLATCYAYGYGVPRDYVEAYKWSNIALARAKPENCIEFQGISVLGEIRFGIFNGTTIGVGEAAFVKTLVGEIKIQCVSIDERSAAVIVEGGTEPKTVYLRDRGWVTAKGALDLRTYLEKRLTKAQISEAQRRATAFVEGKEGVEEPDDRSGIPDFVERRTYSGSGFFVTDDGYLVTCEHVVRGATSFRVKSGTGSHAAKLVKRDKAIDIALLKVDGAFHALPTPPNPVVKLGDAVFTVGFPNPAVQGEKPKLTRGEISSMAGVRDNPSYFQISVPVQPGNSGGALVDESGNAIGVVTARLDDVATLEFSGALPQNVNYAVKGNAVRHFLNSVPGMSAKLKAPGNLKDRDAATAAAERAAVLVIAE